MGWQRGRDDDQGAGPVRDPRLSGFAKDSEWDSCSPSAALTAVLEDASGPEWRCPGATRDEMLGMLAQAQALESRAAAVFPSCNRHAKDSDFEHAVPYDKGGRTCSCNAGARSRACHQVKQSKGWNVTQPRPGWHQWETPSGRTYTRAPKHYPT